MVNTTILKLNLRSSWIVKRKINGKLYTSVYSTDTKAEANKVANNLRKQGIPARVIKFPQSIMKKLDIHGTQYLVLAKGVNWE